MTFVFKDDETFEWPVTIYVPKGGDHDEVTLTAIFAMADDETLLAKPEPTGAHSSMIEVEIDKIMTFFKGWPSGAIQDDQGGDFRPSTENIRRFLNRRPNRLAVTDAYNRAISPTDGARAKN